MSDSRTPWRNSDCLYHVSRGAVAVICNLANSRMIGGGSFPVESAELRHSPFASGSIRRVFVKALCFNFPPSYGALAKAVCHYCLTSWLLTNRTYHTISCRLSCVRQGSVLLRGQDCPDRLAYSTEVPGKSARFGLLKVVRKAITAFVTREMEKVKPAVPCAEQGRSSLHASARLPICCFILHAKPRW